MFTGIIEEIGNLKSLKNSTDSYEITIECKKILEGLKIGDSISCNGVCLTSIKKTTDYFVADIMKETFNVTNFKNLKINEKINLERALPANGRFDGHIVQGHVDSSGKIIRINRTKNSYDIIIETDKETLNYIVKKGSVTIDGISLTVSDIRDNSFQVSIIPHTFNNTNLKFKKIGNQVHIETDIIGRYLKKFSMKNKE